VALALFAAIGYVGWAWSAGTRRGVTLQRPTESEFDLTFPDGVQASAANGVAMLALSRDGNNLVFQGAQPGAEPALYLRRFGDRTVERIRGTDGAKRPVLSPEGSEVLFSVSSPAPAIVRLPIRGGVPKTLIEGVPLGMSASDAGDVLYSVNGRLSMIAREGGTPRLLAVPDSARGHLAYEWPDVLPGSGAALVAIRTNKAYVLGTVRLPGGKVTELGVAGLFPRYSASGHVFYAMEDGRLFAAPFSARSLRVTGPAVLVAEGVRVGSGGGAAYSVSDNGTLAYVEAHGGRRALAIATRTGQVHMTAAPPHSYQFPAVAPDGRRVALTLSAVDARERDVPVQPDIWIYDTTTVALTRLTTDSASSRPAWTSDAQHVAFVRSRDSVVWSLPVSSTARAVPLLASKFVIADFALGPQHGYSALVPAVPLVSTRDIWVAPNDSFGVARPFLQGRYDEFTPVISRDGRWIAYVSDKTGRSEVYARSLIGDGPEIPVSINGGLDPRWNSDGTEVFYRSLGRSAYLMSAKVDGRPALAVVRRDTLFLFAGRAYDPFPGGRAFLLVQDTAASVGGVGPITIVLNWRPASAAQSPEP
jgi:Tol biopolymer transport system component